MEGGGHGIEKKERTAEEERGKTSNGRTDSKKKDLKDKKAKVKDAPDKICKENASSEETADKMLHEGSTGRSGSTRQTERSVFQSTDIRERKKSEGKEISVEELGEGGVTDSKRSELEPEGQQQERDVFTAHNGEENLPQVAPLKKEKQVETNKGGVETTVKENEKQDVANGGATLSEDELLSIRWKNSGNLTTYLHNLATFLGNIPNLKAEESENGNVTFIFPSQLQVFQIPKIQ